MAFGFLRRRSKATLFIGFLMAIGGTAFLLPSIDSLHDAYRLSSPGASYQTLGRVVRLHQSTGRGAATYYVDYTYQVGRMLAHVRNIGVARHNWNDLQAGDGTMPVNYLAADPSVSEPGFSDENGFLVWRGWGHVAYAVFFVMLGYWIALFSQKGEIKRRRKRT